MFALSYVKQNRYLTNTKIVITNSGEYNGEYFATELITANSMVQEKYTIQILQI